MQGKRILLVNDFYFGGGAEGVFRDTYDLLKIKGCDVDLFFGGEYKTSPSNALTYFYNRDIERKFAERLSVFRPEIIHIHNYYHYLSPAIFTVIKKYKARNSNVTVIYTAHDYHLICPSSGMMVFNNGQVRNISPDSNDFQSLLFKSIDHRGWKFSLIKKLYWWWALKINDVLQAIDLIISPSEFLKNAFTAYGVKKPIVVVRNPMNMNVPSDIQERKTPCSTQIRILFIGRLSQEKGLFEFLDAFFRSEFAKINVHIDILGVGDEESRLKQLVKAKGASNVVFHGFKQGDELEKFLIDSNVLLLSSLWYENAPLSLIEGAAYGNVLLVRNLGGMTELSKLTKSFILVDDWERELNNVLSRLTEMPPNHVLDVEVFSPSYYVDRLVRLYNEPVSKIKIN